MNDKQKIFVMVGVGSFVVLLITIFGLGYYPVYETTDPNNVNDSITRFDFSNIFSIYRTKSTQDPSGLSLATNWLGIIAIFNIVFSITGFFLFKDK